MAEGLDFQEFLAGFLAEADEHLALAARNLLAADAALAAGTTPAREVRSLFRSLHTLKGLAAMVGVEPIVELSHQMESVLRAADAAGGRLSRAAVDVLLRGVRVIEARVAALAQHRPVEPIPGELLEALAVLDADAATAPARAPTIDLEPELLARLSASERAVLTNAAAAGQRVLRIEFRPSPDRVAAGLTITSLRERLSAAGEIVKVIPRSLPPSPEAPGGLAFNVLFCTTRSAEELVAATGLSPTDLQWVPVHAAEPLRAPAAAGAGEELELEPDPDAGRRPLVRVDVARLDDALEKLSALLVTRHRLSHAVARLGNSGADVRELSLAVQETARQLRDLRGSIMAARMVPVAEVLDRVPLVVRGLSRSTGKPLALQLALGDAEVDKAVGQRLFPAVIHLIRNAVDHGIEPAAERVAAGKPAEGRISVDCHQRGSSQLELKISDDGRGVNAHALAARAGVDVPRDSRALLALLTRPGLSSLVDASRTSGRGMGMDIVRRIVEEQLSGELELVTEPGRGTTFILRVPLTIIIVDAFTFVVGDERFAVPVSAVEEIVEVDPSRVIQGPAPGGGAGRRKIIERRGEAMSLVGLAHAFSMTQFEQDVRKALIIRRNAEPIAFGVSRMLGQQEIVVRPLEDPLVRVPGISGATDLGDGKPVLVLDLAALAGAARSPRGERA